MPNAIEYIGKNGTTLGDSSRIDRKHKESKYSAILDNATTTKGFMDLVRQEDPRSYVLNHERLEYFAKRKFGDFTEPVEPEFKTEDFVNVPQEVFDWVNNELNSGKSRPKNLVLIGGRGFAKTSLARSFGPHHYWVNRFTSRRTRDARYAVMDDFDTIGDHKNDFKGFWGSQKEVGVKIANGQSGHVSWEWGIPTIWCWNSLPEILHNSSSYERESSILVYISKPLYRTEGSPEYPVNFESAAERVKGEL